MFDRHGALLLNLLELPTVAPDFPKGVDIAAYSQDQLNEVARKLNERPRKTLEYRTPAERFSQLVASID
jgi:IS30 family transposase